MPLDLAARLGGAGGRNSVLFVPHNTGEEREIYQPAARTNRLSFQWVNISRLLLGRRRSSCSAAGLLCRIRTGVGCTAERMARLGRL